MSGRIFLFGDNIDTDQLAPGQYMKDSLAELAAHCLEGVRPDFAANARTGDILVAGTNFGMGSSREQAVQALLHLGISGIVARSFAGIFYRNAINLGLPALLVSDLAQIEDGELAELDIEASELRLPGRKQSVQLEPLPDNLKQMLTDGGLVPHLKKRFETGRTSRTQE